MFLNLFRDGGALLEDQPAGDESIPLAGLLDERAAKCLTALLGALESFELSHACGALVMAGIRLTHKDTRRHAVTS